jgi:CxxC motif-containing protein (DUF1111 family)
MPRHYRLFFPFPVKTPGLVLATFLLCLPCPPAFSQAQHPLDAAAGKALFERNWVAAPASTASSDGLGPFYNARSCNTCHPGGGRGAGLQAITVVINDPVYGRQLQPLALAGMQPEVELALAWIPVELPMDDGTPYSLQRLQVDITHLSHGALQSASSPRLAPSLHGLALLAAVSEAELEARADPEDSDGDGISGRLSLLESAGTARVGRFGWKAEMPDLRMQAAKAFSLDLGLGTELFPAPHGDCTAAQAACLQGVSGAVTGASATELGTELVELVLAYVTGLEPAQSAAPDPEGAQLFQQIGCASCHVPQLQEEGFTVKAYTDLLLHDLGSPLASTLDAPNALGSEWRTAPLWGLAGSERFLHDGRARNLEEAVLWHAGEAAKARNNYLELLPKQRQRLLDFLKTR